LREQILRIGGQAAVDQVIAGYSDVCCQQLKDPQDHYSTKLFRCVERALIKDPWHLVRGVLDETTGFSHPLYEPFRNMMWSNLLKWDKESEKEALAHFREYHEEGKRINTHELAREQMYKTAQYKNSIYNFIEPDGRKILNDTKAGYEKLKAQDLAMAAEAATDRKSYQYFFKKEVFGIQRGTQRALENYYSHLLKNCQQDLMPMHEMSYEAKKQQQDKGPSVKKRKRGTNLLENNNKQGKRQYVDQHISCQRSCQTHKKMMLFAHSHNLRCDADIEHITKKKARKRNWFVQEALQKDVGDFVDSRLFPDDEYPPTFNMFADMEPIGERYLQWKNWKEADRQIESICGAEAEFMIANEPSAHPGSPLAFSSPAGSSPPAVSLPVGSSPPAAPLPVGSPGTVVVPNGASPPNALSPNPGPRSLPPRLATLGIGTAALVPQHGVVK
jgi:hypothetical protein